MATRDVSGGNVEDESMKGQVQRIGTEQKGYHKSLLLRVVWLTPCQAGTYEKRYTTTCTLWSFGRISLYQAGGQLPLEDEYGGYK